MIQVQQETMLSEAFKVLSPYYILNRLSKHPSLPLDALNTSPDLQFVDCPARAMTLSGSGVRSGSGYDLCRYILREALTS